MKFPLKSLSVKTNSSEREFLSSYKDVTEVPLLPHPGAFGKQRKNHIHEGVDLYCQEQQEVISIEDGVVVGIYDFTGEKVNTPWWNNTACILIAGASGTFNYGEIQICKDINVGDKISEGQTLGFVTPVLKINKGRPMNMLHLELYSHGTCKHVDEWSLGTEQPKNLLDPTPLLLSFLNK